jgi:hypothetical protein
MMENACGDNNDTVLLNYTLYIILYKFIIL